jgi:hypothetical protein
VPTLPYQVWSTKELSNASDGRASAELSEESPQAFAETFQISLAWRVWNSIEFTYKIMDSEKGYCGWVHSNPVFPAITPLLVANRRSFLRLALFLSAELDDVAKRPAY